MPAAPASSPFCLRSASSDSLIVDAGCCEWGGAWEVPDWLMTMVLRRFLVSNWSSESEEMKSIFFSCSSVFSSILVESSLFALN